MNRVSDPNSSDTERSVLLIRTYVSTTVRSGSSFHVSSVHARPCANHVRPGTIVLLVLKILNDSNRSTRIRIRISEQHNTIKIYIHFSFESTPPAFVVYFITLCVDRITNSRPSPKRLQKLYSTCISRAIFIRFETSDKHADRSYTYIYIYVREINIIIKEIPFRA